MKTIKIAMSNELLHIDNSKILKVLGAPSNLIIVGDFNRTRIVANEVEPFLKATEYFENCSYAQNICFMHLKVVRVLKSYTKTFDEMIERGLILSYEIL